MIFHTLRDALARPVQGCHCYEIAGQEGTVYVWATQPVYAKAEAMKFWEATAKPDLYHDIMDTLDALTRKTQFRGERDEKAP